MTRRRSRYAPDDQVRRVARLAQEMGIQPSGLTLGADGSVTVLDSAGTAAVTSRGGETAEDALAAWEREHGSAGRS